MFVPATASVGLAVALCSMVCWGSWSNFLIVAERQMPFELFYIDFSVACLVCALIFAFTLGTFPESPNPIGTRTFMDDFDADPSRFLLALVAGLLFNIANICLCKGISMLGLALAFPLCIGTSMVLGTVLTYAIDPGSTAQPVFLFVGLAIAFLAVVTAAVMHSIKDKEKAAKEPLAADAEGGESTKDDATMTRKLVICIVGGIFMGSWNPLVALAQHSTGSLFTYKPGLSPYGEFVFYTIAVVLSSLVLIPLIISYPMEGFEGQKVGPVLAKYGKIPLVCHIYAFLAGAVWSIGTWANVAAGAAVDFTGQAVMAPATSYAIGQCANVAAIFWGLILWGEFNGTSAKVKGLVALVVVLYVVAIAFVTLSNL